MAPLQNTDSTSGHYWGLVSTSPLGRRSYRRHLIPTPSSLTLPVAMGLRLPGTLSSAMIQVLSLKFHLNTGLGPLRWMLSLSEKKDCLFEHKPNGLPIFLNSIHRK